MRYLKLFESFEDNVSKIHELCRRYNIENYTINHDGTVDVNDDVWINSNGLTKLPLKFNKINGHFICSRNKLTTLEGSPVEVNGDFWCANNYLTSFQYAPKIIRAGFYCEWNNIKTFEYFPSFVRDNFYCSNNPIDEIWDLFEDTTKIELLNDFDIFRGEDTDTPAIVMDRLNDFLTMIGKEEVEKVNQYKNI